MKSRAAYWLLALPFIGLLYPGFYNRLTPALFGLPFFYWYQLVWIVITALLLGTVVVVTRAGDDL